jgi:shikimate kinase/3-dehydroquinate synthase
MALENPDRIILIGPSGSGKSELATRIAAHLGYGAVDVDALIVERTGMPIAEFFARFGEAAFRAIESEVIVEICQLPRTVVATGGGAVLAPRNWEAWRANALIIALMATPETLVARVHAQGLRDGSTAQRPLLAGDAVARMRALLSQRAALYAQADATIDTEGRELEHVVADVLAAVRNLVRGGRVPALSIGTPVARSDIYVRSGMLTCVPAVVRQRWPRAERLWVISDEHVAERWLPTVSETFSNANFQTREIIVASGEASKRMAVVARVCEDMTRQGVTRRDVVVALGGGVVGDLAGFVASVALRGLSLVQLPTSLLAMVDSSVGGKTGVNAAVGKNMIGAFYQPGVVAIDPAFLKTLPRAEWRSGMAEVIKHALIQPSTPFGGRSLQEALEAAPALDPLRQDIVEAVLRLNVEIKASVVRADEREDGLRMILNFGHTAGHAIEADGYRYRHGEAVAIGMIVAMRIAQHLGRVGEDRLAALERLITAAGLPTTFEGAIDGVLDALGRDKKNLNGAIRWILPASDGGVEPVTGVPAHIVREALIATGGSC